MEVIDSKKLQQEIDRRLNHISSELHKTTFHEVYKQFLKGKELELEDLKKFILKEQQIMDCIKPTIVPDKET